MITGVEDVTTDSKASKVVVKGKAADPIKVCERLQKKSGRKVEIISPLPKPSEENKEENKQQKEEEKKEEVKFTQLIIYYLTLYILFISQYNKIYIYIYISIPLLLLGGCRRDKHLIVLSYIFVKLFKKRVSKMAYFC